MENKKYLVILDFENVVAQLNNVGVIEARDSLEARVEMLRYCSLSDDALRFIKAFELDELERNWRYFDTE